MSAVQPLLRPPWKPARSAASLGYAAVVDDSRVTDCAERPTPRRRGVRTVGRRLQPQPPPQSATTRPTNDVHSNERALGGDRRASVLSEDQGQQPHHELSPHCCDRGSDETRAREEASGRGGRSKAMKRRRAGAEKYRREATLCVAGTAGRAPPTTARLRRQCAARGTPIGTSSLRGTSPRTASPGT